MVVVDTAGLTTYGNFTVEIVDVNEPVITQPLVCNITENSPAGTPVCDVPYWDPDAGSHVTFHLVEGNAEDTFHLDTKTGTITVRSPPDFEHIPHFELVINMTDNGPGDAFDAETLVSVFVMSRSLLFC